MGSESPTAENHEAEGSNSAAYASQNPPVGANESKQKGSEKAQPRHHKRKHDSFERTSLAVSILLCIATIAAAGFAGWLAFLTHDMAHDARVTADRQFAEMESEQRPWVSIPSTDAGLSIQITQPLTFQKNGNGDIRTSLFLRNTGRKPAFGVRWHSKIMAIHGTRSITEEVGEALANYCEPIRKQSPEILERTLFPDDRYLEQQFPSAVYPADIADAFADKRKKIVSLPGKLEFAFIGCVDYRDGNAAHHQSRYAFLMGAPQQGGGWMGYLKPEGVHPELRLIEFLQSAD